MMLQVGHSLRVGAEVSAGFLSWGRGGLLATFSVEALIDRHPGLGSLGGSDGRLPSCVGEEETEDSPASCPAELPDQTAASSPLRGMKLARQGDSTVLGARERWELVSELLPHGVVPNTHPACIST